MTGDSRQWFVLALLVVLGWLIYKLAPVITPFAISAALAYLGDPLVDRLQRLRVYKWPVARTAAVIIVFLLMTAAVGLLLLFILPMVREQILYLVRRAPEMVEWLMGTALPWLQAKLGLAPGIDRQPRPDQREGDGMRAGEGFREIDHGHDELQGRVQISHLPQRGITEPLGGV